MFMKTNGLIDEGGGKKVPAVACFRCRATLEGWLTEGTMREFRGGNGAKIKNIASKATKCMKTLGQLKKCHDEKAKIRRKYGPSFGHFR